MSEEEPVLGRFERWVRTGATVVAPATLLTSLLFYFGYVSTRSQYEYFGIDVDVIGLATQDYVMRSPQPLLTPLLVLTFVGVGSLALHNVLRGQITTDSASRRLRWLMRGFATVGLALLGAGVVLLLLYTVIRDWLLYGVVTPVLIAVGGAIFVYASRVLNLMRPNGSPRGGTLLRSSSATLFFVVIAASVFWTTATVAQWSGRGLAMYQAQHLDRLPSVILDTKERLFLRSPGIDETTLQESQGQTFHYRYRHLRLLIQGHDRMFLVPDAWSPSDTTLVVPLDGSIRVQFQFQNERP